MCRWLAYSGSSIALDEVLYKPAHSLIDQSRHARLGVETTNGDGFGVGWYGEPHESAEPGAPFGQPGQGAAGNGVVDRPAVFRGVGPAWANRNLRELAGSVRSPLFLAHIRASTGTAVQESNCHPFRHGRWLWQHNGLIAQFHRIKRELVLAVDPSLYTRIEGSTDTEVMFYLALTFGLEDDPPGAVERMAGMIELVGRDNGIPYPVQMTVATTDGQRVWSFRYSSEGASRSLFYSTDIRTLREMYPDNPAFQHMSEETRLIVSEPLGDLPGAWRAVPEAHWGVIQEGDDEIHPFRPRLP